MRARARTRRRPCSSRCEESSAARRSAHDRSGGRRSPSKIASPPHPGASSLDAKSTCIPRQMPRYGTPRAMLPRIASPSPTSSARAQSRNAPCPGTTTLSARAIASASRVISTLTPAAPTSSAARVSARSTLRKFPSPTSTIAICTSRRPARSPRSPAPPLRATDPPASAGRRCARRGPPPSARRTTLRASGSSPS